MNLALDVTNEFIVRFAAAKVMARPQIGNSFSGANYLVPTTSLAAGGPNFTASIGNVELDPFRATTYDLSFEWYFAPQSLLSLALFYKDIEATSRSCGRPPLRADRADPEAFAPGFCPASLASTCSS